MRNLQSRHKSWSWFETLCPINVNLPLNDAKNLARHFSRLILALRCYKLAGGSIAARDGKFRGNISYGRIVLLISIREKLIALRLGYLRYGIIVFKTDGI